MDKTNLLEIAREELLDKVLPLQSGAARYSALMVAKAIAVHLRAARAGPSPAAPEKDLAELCRKIRDGALDPGTEGFGQHLNWLAAQNTHELSISNPRFLEEHNKTNEESVR